MFKNVVTYKPDRSCVTPFCKEPNAEIVEIEGISRRFLRLAPCKGCYITSVRFIPLEKRLICWIINRELIKPTDAPPRQQDCRRNTSFWNDLIIWWSINRITPNKSLMQKKFGKTHNLILTLDFWYIDIYPISQKYLSRILIFINSRYDFLKQLWKVLSSKWNFWFRLALGIAIRRGRFWGFLLLLLLFFFFILYYFEACPLL